MSRPQMALSIQQPWAYAILHLGKNIENRTWPTRFRGRIMIHAGKKFDREGMVWLESMGYELTGAAGQVGGYVGEVTITDCIPFEDFETEGDHPNLWACGPYCFLLKGPVAYDRIIPARGRLGFFRVEGL